MLKAEIVLDGCIMDIALAPALGSRSFSLSSPFPRFIHCLGASTKQNNVSMQCLRSGCILLKELYIYWVPRTTYIEKGFTNHDSHNYPNFSEGAQYLGTSRSEAPTFWYHHFAKLKAVMNAAVKIVQFTDIALGCIHWSKTNNQRFSCESITAGHLR